MRTLAIDTSHAAGSVAAASAGQVVERRLGMPRDHARRLAAVLAEATAALGWRPAAVELVAVVSGPGSFTGLRVGVTTAKAVAWASGATLVAVNAFDVVAVATARELGRDVPLAICFDAGRGDVYAALATPDVASPSRWRLGRAALVPAAGWPDTLPHDCIVTGPALASCDGLLPRVTPAPAAGWFPTARVALDVAGGLLAAGVVAHPQSLVPEYLRPSYAEERAAPA